MSLISLSLSEASDSSGSSSSTDYQLVPDSESEYGYRVEEAPSTWKTLTEEELLDLVGDAPTVQTNALSGEISFLFALTASVCLAYLLSRFLKPRLGRMKWAGTALLAAVFFTLYQYHWWVSITFERYSVLPVMELAALFGVICLFYRKGLSKKIYLAVTFQAVFGLCGVLRTYGTLFLEHLCDALDLSTQPVLSLYTYELDPDVYVLSGIVSVGFDWTGCLMLLLSCAALVLATRKLASGGCRDAERIPRGELLFLVTPAAAAIVFTLFTQVAHLLLKNPVFVDWATWDSPFLSLTLYLLIPLLAAASLLCILYAYTIYQKLVSYLEEKQRAAVLANQVEQMQGHIREIEQLYTGIRSMRHDMHNYLFDIKSLLAARGIDVDEPGTELAGYFSGIGTALDALNYSIHTGNPVTDVVLNGKARRAKAMGVRFDSTFRFPADYGIDAFDLSIILNNGLDNALEACEALGKRKPEIEAYIRIISYCKNNMLMVEIENSFDGVLLSTEGGAPRTRKRDVGRHGLGFQTILRCAEKYLGSAVYTSDVDTFHLTVMLQRAGTPPQSPSEDIEKKKEATV